MAESEDCIDWTERELIVAPDEDDPPQDHELYGMSSMQVRSDEKHRR
jgi:sucrose-6-phosphate hydrolase SacC (GH32 family)